MGANILYIPVEILHVYFYMYFYKFEDRERQRGWEKGEKQEERRKRVQLQFYPLWKYNVNWKSNMIQIMS